MSSIVRVLHSLSNFLPVTENWIYPQVTAVPGIDSAVYCCRTLNLAEFPLNGHPLFVQHSPFWCSIPNLAIHRRAIRWAVNRATQHRARIVARRWHPSLVHAHFGMRGWESLRLARSFGIPLITSFYGYDAWEMPAAFPEWRRRLKQLFAQGDLFLAMSFAFRQRLIDLGCPPDKIRIQRLGVDLGRFNYSHRAFTGPINIAMVGRFVEKKGLLDGLAACLRAVQRGVNLQVTIIGDVVDNDTAGLEIKRQLLALAAVPALAGHVFFRGFVSPSTLPSILKHQNILLCPSKHAASGDAEGGMPVVLAEAMAMGLIGIGSRHCDIEELIMDGRTGYLFDEGDVDGLTELLCKMPSMAERAWEIAEAARRHVEQNFDLPRQLASLGDIYRACVERKFSPMHVRANG